MTIERIAQTPSTTAAMLTSVGNKVRATRREKGMTLADLSDITGLSQASISQIERGLANPSFTTLSQLAYGLDIPMGKFFVGTDSTSPVVRASQRRNLIGVITKAEGEAVCELLTPALDGALQAQWVETPPGHDSSTTPFRHSGEEFGIIISGRKDIYLDGECYSLEAGDSITFSSEIPHWFTNSYEEVCVAVWVNAPHAW